MNRYQTLFAEAQAAPRYIVGIMSGTSGDGIDAALVRFGDDLYDVVLAAWTFAPFESDLRARILDAGHGVGSPEILSRLSVELSIAYADAVNDLLATAALPTGTRVLAVGCHGQTVSHIPHGAFPATLQLCDAATLAHRTGLPVVSNFRAGDVALGGQGAPLVPLADWRLLTHPTRSRAVQNIGGIGNVTFLPAGDVRPAGATPEIVLGFDTGAGNMLIDLAARWATNGTMAFDENGEIAARGTVIPSLLAWLFEHPFLSRIPPKSAGREEFGETLWNALLAQRVPAKGASGDTGLIKNDVLATVTAFTAISIAEAYANFLPTLPDEVIVSGGGAKNPTLTRMLRDKLGTIPVHTADELGINSAAREAVAFAVLADETLHDRPISLPAVTGASRAAFGGSVTLPP